MKPSDSSQVEGTLSRQKSLLQTKHYHVIFSLTSVKSLAHRLTTLFSVYKDLYPTAVTYSDYLALMAED